MLSDGMATTSAVATSDEAVSEPHQGHVGLLRDHLGNWWVHHAITMETKQLEANELWTLVFDEDGVGCAAGLNPDCILFLDDIMEKTLLRRGERWLLLHQRRGSVHVLDRQEASVSHRSHRVAAAHPEFPIQGRMPPGFVRPLGDGLVPEASQ